MKCKYKSPTIHNCLNCKLPDCDNDEVGIDDFRLSEQLDREANEKPVDPEVLARAVNDKRFREKNKEKVLMKDRNRNTGKRQEDKKRRSKEYYERHKEECQTKMRLIYWKNKEKLSGG